MARGGWHGRGGPPPDPLALRRDRPSDGQLWVVLVADEHAAAVPAWPLADPTSRELEVWAAEWLRPQSVIWERQRQALEVAMYVRTLVAAEHPDAKAAMRILVLRQMESLAISATGMQRHRWRIAESSPAAQSAPAAQLARRASRPRTRSQIDMRERMKLITDGGES